MVIKASFLWRQLPSDEIKKAGELVNPDSREPLGVLYLKASVGSDAELHSFLGCFCPSAIKRNKA